MAKEKKIDPALSKDLVVVQGVLAKLPKTITSDKEYNFVESANKQAKDFKKKVEDFFKKAEKPLKDAIKALKEEKDPLLEPAEQILEATKPLIGAWALKKEQEAEKERKRLQAEADKAAKEARKNEIAELRESGDAAAARALRSAPVISQEVVVANSAERDDLSFRKDVVVEIIDIDLVPDEYINKTLRLADVKAAWKAAEFGLIIPGLKLTETRTPVRG